MVNILDLYNKINKIIINNYNMNKRNYHILQNIYYLHNNNNKTLIKEMNTIIKDNTKIY